jgi:hypothetical protein
MNTNQLKQKYRRSCALLALIIFVSNYCFSVCYPGGDTSIDLVSKVSSQARIETFFESPPKGEHTAPVISAVIFDTNVLASFCHFRPRISSSTRFAPHEKKAFYHYITINAP